MNILPLTFEFDAVSSYEKQEKITGDIIEKKNGKIGSFELYIIEGNEDLKGFVDQYRGEEDYSNWYPMNVFHAMEYDDANCEIDGKIAFLQSIIIDEKYRNCGIGTSVMNKIIVHLKKEKINNFILQPSPILDSNETLMGEDEVRREQRFKLINFYQKNFGFEKVKTKKEYDYPIYYLKIS